MVESSRRESRSRGVVVVGVDLSHVSKHVLAKARDLVCWMGDAELHLVHVVEPHPIRRLVLESLHSIDTGARNDPEPARRQLQGFCESILGSLERFVVHVPVGRPADELARIARETAADIIVVEAHDHARRVFHRAVVARLARIAPCSVLAIRDPTRGAPEFVSSRTAMAP